MLEIGHVLDHVFAGMGDVDRHGILNRLPNLSHATVICTTQENFKITAYNFM